MPGRRLDQLLPAMPACLSQALHCKNKWKQHTPDRKREAKTHPQPPHAAPSAGLSQGPGQGYLLLLFQGSCWCQICIYHKQRQHNVIILLLSFSPLFLLPPQTHTLTQNDGSLDSLNEQSPQSPS